MEPVGLGKRAVRCTPLEALASPNQLWCTCLLEKEPSVKAFPRPASQWLRSLISRDAGGVLESPPGSVPTAPPAPDSGNPQQSACQFPLGGKLHDNHTLGGFPSQTDKQGCRVTGSRRAVIPAHFSGLGPCETSRWRSENRHRLLPAQRPRSICWTQTHHLVNGRLLKALHLPSDKDRSGKLLFPGNSRSF